ncbi:hypothetical protein J2S71_000659 [Olsenella profusa DSM 13989]|uniref:Uncharacterized protein n=1 Tax=Olsenella profusa F0195 TaxID=1125712 RepID=U2THR9_9ACTN|nr:hypothetical protein [Olsenella profusa]ERL06020.1 hypothetical protein HMPREF1316_0792 [Olsenella profusa F0195]MDP9858963.1 hypothetical protein [Olsenella profusa DSM 13989]
MRSKGRLILTGVLVGTAVAAYRLLLTDDARENLRSAVMTVVDGYGRVSDALGIRRSYADEDEVLARNREELRQEWESVGF